MHPEPFPDPPNWTSVHISALSRGMSAPPPSAVEPRKPPWSLPVGGGRLIEISGGRDAPLLTAAASALAQAQRRGDVAAWVESAVSSFYPPDVAAWGIDFDALPVIRLPQKETAYGLLRATEILLRTGGFDLVIVDLTDVRAPRTSDAAWQGRLLGLARTHSASVLFLTRKHTEMQSLGPLVSLRLEPRIKRVKKFTFEITYTILKDKRGEFATSTEVVRGCPGLP